MIHFGWPWIFILLPAPLLFRSRTRKRTASLRIPPDLESALAAVQNQSSRSINARFAFLWLAWILTLVALSQPWIPGDTSVLPVSGRAVSLVVDVSTSMERQDFSLNGEISDRLSVVKQVAHEFILARAGDRLSLILFGKQAFIAAPLTFDLTALSSILDSAGIGMAGKSTAIGDAIGLAIKSLQDDPADNKAIVLLSDGTDNAGSVDPESAAQLAHSLNIRIHTIAMGSQDGEISGYAMAQSADLDEKTLRDVAQMTGGTFYRASSSAELAAVYTAIDQLERAEVDAPPIILRHDLYIGPLLALLALLIGMAYRERAKQ